VSQQHFIYDVSDKINSDLQKALSQCLYLTKKSWLRCASKATFMIYVCDFHRNFMISWFVTVCVRDFHELCPRLSPRGSFGKSWRNGIWA